MKDRTKPKDTPESLHVCLKFKEAHPFSDFESLIAGAMPGTVPEFEPPEQAPPGRTRPADPPTPGRPARPEPDEIPDPERDPMRSPERRREIAEPDDTELSPEPEIDPSQSIM